MIKTKIIKVAKDKQRSGTGFYNSPTYSNSSTNINVDSELSESSTNPVQNAVITNELNQIKADAVNTVSNTDNTLDISKSGNTVTINSKTWKFNENGDLIYDGTIIPNEVVTSILNADTATLETLTVTKAAHFFQLVIDEIKSTKGQILITAANAKLDKVEETTDNYKCYWKTTDDNKKIYNQFAVDDQVICQTFNTLLDGNTNLVNDSTFTDLSNWSASDTYKPLDNSKVTVEDGEVSFISENNTCYLAQRLNLSPSTEYTIKFDMKQDVASYSNVSFIFHSPIIDTTKPYFTNGDAFINNQTLNGIDGNIDTEYKTFYITFTTLPTLPSICNMEFVCTNAESENVTTFIRNIELVAASKNKYYWNKVVSVGQSLIDGETYNYIEVSKTDKDSKSNSFPEVGDEIAQLGNRSDTDRQAAIIISAYNNQYLDNAIQAPSIVQYNGINDFNLNTHRLNVISKGFNSFRGNFTTTAGEDIANNSRKNFPIIKPFYDSSMNTIVTNYLSDPIRYNGGDDIYSTPTYVEKGTYNFRIFSTVSNASSLLSWFALCSYGTKYPSDISDYETVDLPLSNGGTIRAKNSTTLYEYKCTVTIPTSGYYAINFWYGSEYIYIPNDEDTFEISNSKIEQTNTRITTQVNNINGQISTINQKADSIEAAVNDVNVRLDNGGFTINADTSINGSLTVTDAKQGFILNGANGNTYIVGDSIGTYEQFKSRTYVVNYYNATTTSSSTSQTVRFNTTLNMGQLPINTTLDFQNFEVVIKRINSIRYQLSDYSYQLNLKKDGTVVHGISGDNSATPSVGTSYTTNGTIGNYVMEIQFLGTVITVDSVPQCQGTIYFETKVYTSTFNLIGTDGIASNFGVNKTFYVGNEGTYIRYTDDNVLKISNEGIQKYAGSIYYKKQDKGEFTDTCTSKYIKEFSPINGLTVRTVTALDSNNSNCYLQPNDEMILFKLTNSDSGKRCNVCLPQPTTYNCGRKVYLKKMTGYGNIYVWGDSQKQTGLKLIRTADGSTVTNREIDYASRYFISDGEFWIEFYSG